VKRHSSKVYPQKNPGRFHNNQSLFIDCKKPKAHEIGGVRAPREGEADPALYAENAPKLYKKTQLYPHVHPGGLAGLSLLIQ
jgi:hypothetical protein